MDRHKPIRTVSSRSLPAFSFVFAIAHLLAVPRNEMRVGQDHAVFTALNQSQRLYWIRARRAVRGKSRSQGRNQQHRQNRAPQ